MLHTVLGLALAATLPGQTLHTFEIRKPPGSATGTLVAQVDDRQANLSNSAARAWKGWHPSILIYTQVLADGREELRVFNAITGGQTTIATEQLSIHDISVARLESGDYALILFARDSDGQPWLALADPKKGVYRRIPNATAGAIFKDRVEVRFFDPADPKAKNPDLREVQPSRVALIPLQPEAPEP